MENSKPFRRQRETTEVQSLENRTKMNNTIQNTRPSVSGQKRVLRIPGGKIKQNLVIGTWNVRSLYEPGKLNNTISEMNRLEMDILGISETWWTECGEFRSENVTVYHSGNQNGVHRKGVGIIVKNNIAPCVTGFIPMSDRTMLIKIRGKPLDINIIQVYAPTCDANVNEVDEFYDDIGKLIKMTKQHEITLIMGDFNAKIGKDEVLNISGKYGLGERNDRGDRLVQFCQEHKMKVTNTLFRLHPRRLYTWKSPQDCEGNIVRNQIDYILINRRYCSCVKKCSTYPGADVPSDHNLLIANIRIKLAVNRKKKARPRINLEKLNDPTVKSQLRHQINNQIAEIKEENIDNLWDNVREVINTTTKNTLGKRLPAKSEEWITDEILELRKERSKYKNKNYEKYWEINKEIRMATRAAKNKILNQKCQEIEFLQNIHDNFNLHKKLKETAGVYRKVSPAILVDDNNEAVFELENKKQIWKDYVANLFTDNERSRPESNLERPMTGTPITRDEVEFAIRSLKDKKATGPDEIPSEVLKLIEGNNLQLLVKVFNHIYDTGHYPEDWLKSTFIAIPKKTNAKKCSEYRLISLMSHALKIFLKIIHKRIYTECEAAMGETQFGFKEGMGTREALFSVQILIQKCREAQKDVFICFVDYEKAFDTVKHDKLMDILTSIGINEKEIRCIKNLYWNQSAQINVNGEKTDEIPISKGVRQGCILSPLLFNIYSEKIFQETLYGENIGVKINGKLINNIRYADDTTLIASSISGLQKLIEKLARISETYGLKINLKKTKYMVINSKNTHTINITNNEIERVTSFKYLGVLINEQWDPSKEIKCRIEMARDAFFKYSKVLMSHDINVATKVRFIKCFIWSVLLYGAEVWTIKTSDEARLEAFEMWIFRRVLKIPWTAKISNVEVLRRMNVNRQLMLTIKKRKISYLGHILRNNKYKILQSVLKGKIEGKRSRGRRKISWLKNIQTWTGYSDESILLNAAKNRELSVIS